MSEAPHVEQYDAVSTLTLKVGGADARVTIQRVVDAIRRGFELVGPDAIITVTVATHAPKRRLTEGQHGN